MHLVLEELRYAVRVLLRRRLLTGVAVLTLGLGLGLTASMFAVVNGVVLRGLPVRAPGRLRYVERAFASERSGNAAVPLADFLDWRRAQRSFEALAAFQLTVINVSGTPAQPERYTGALVTANLFDVLGVEPAVGRRFLESEDRPGAPPVVIVGDEVWRTQFGAARSLDGLTLKANGETRAVVGVMPPGFGFPLGEEVWVPMTIAEQGGVRQATPSLQVIGRLQPGVSEAAAQADLSTIAARLAEAHPDTNAGVGVVLRTHVRKFMGDDAVGIFYAVLFAVIGVLLIAATNVTNLLLALGLVRSREMAVRSSLGASRWRLLSQTLLEALVLAVAGALLGLALAWTGVAFFNDAIAGTHPPFWVDIRLGATEVLFVIGLVVLVTAVAGAIPAVRASRAHAAEILKDEVRGSTGGRVGRFSRALVTAEVALSFGLLVAAGLMVRTVVAVTDTNFGFSTDDVLTGAVTLPAAAYPDQAERLRFWDEVTQRLDRQPGIHSVALTSVVPGTGTGRLAIGLEGEVYASPRDHPRVRALVVGPRFFDTFGARLLAGRDFRASDVAGSAAVAIVNDDFTRRFFHGQSPLGRRVLVMPDDGPPAPVTIVGVAPNVRLGGVRNLEPEAIYLPLAQHVASTMNVAVRTYGDPRALAPGVREAVSAIDLDLPVYGLQTMRHALYLTTWFYGVFGVVFIVFGVVALVLVIVGLYGLMAFSVARRTREIGVRMAMGAGRGHVLSLVLGQAFVQLIVGLVVGAVLAAYLSRLLVVLLVGVQPFDPLVLTAIVVALVVTSSLAALGPALRATRINPTEALRHE